MTDIDYEPWLTAYARLSPLPDAGTGLAILVAGVPGAGKSTLAEGLARALRVPVFSMDWQLGALMPARVLTNENVKPIAELMIAASMARQLQLGLDAILDVAACEAEVRARHQAVAARLGARFVGIECVCSDETLHRSRVEGRDRGIPGWKPTVPWEHVLRMKGRWEPWTEPHLLLDSANQGPEEMLKRALDAVAAVEG
ncbi:ATP-binding protein [Actinospica durhamensis]|uniref:ATP-binding protein n=1 Tax=Actinospica durhamensis TaxID=1508375 RepID=A0A941IP00_9ACTN|nr:AAA family ATPase [Actinospica durhamensis]MBR7834554.1 ATP-binding protein [Actinospica durhamensis]